MARISATWSPEPSDDRWVLGGVADAMSRPGNPWILEAVAGGYVRLEPNGEFFYMGNIARDQALQYIQKYVSDITPISMKTSTLRPDGTIVTKYNERHLVNEYTDPVSGEIRREYSDGSFEVDVPRTWGTLKNPPTVANTEPPRPLPAPPKPPRPSSVGRIFIGDNVAQVPNHILAALLRAAGGTVVLDMWDLAGVNDETIEVFESQDPYRMTIQLREKK